MSVATTLRRPALAAPVHPAGRMLRRPDVPLIITRPRHGTVFVEALTEPQDPRSRTMARWVLAFSIAIFGGTVVMLAFLEWLTTLA